MPSFTDTPKLLQDLLKLDTPQARAFRLNIRAYNSMLSMASRNITGKETDFGTPKGPPVYKISGSIIHLSSNLLPDVGKEKNRFQFDNRWVVPYNIFLLLKNDSHMNVEFVGSFATVKYIYK